MAGDVFLANGPEFDRIRAIARALGPSASDIGDDCALISIGGETLAISVDLSVEHVHFRREWLTMRDIGWRAASGALSDLAAVGADPIGILTAIGVPPDSPADALRDLALGCGDAAVAAGGHVLGGDLSASNQWTIDVTVLGRAPHPIRRSGAQSGDGIYVTGWLGGSAAALSLLLSGEPLPDPVRARFAHPIPRVSAGRWLAMHGAHAMIDLSDGIAGDAGHLAAASGVAIRLDLGLLPLESGVAGVAQSLGEPAPLFAARGGEDYELLVAMPSDFTLDDALEFQSVTGLPLTRIGEVVSGHDVHLTHDGSRVDLVGYDHFR
ncbi:MAG: thiamine-phosphate kinase [Gemmatimonadota bacterium]